MTPTYTSSNCALNTYTKLMRAAETVTNRTSRVMVHSNLTISQFGVLEALYHRGSLCQRDLASKILKSTGNITLVIDNLEKRNLVRRQRDNQDRRYLTIHLTSTGMELIADVFKLVETSIITEMSTLTEEEQHTLGSLCKKLGLRNSDV